MEKPPQTWLLAAILMAVTGTAGATTTLVDPGLDTLKDAVAAASPGDTLVLIEGAYDSTGGNIILIDKSLTLRSESRAARPGVFDVLEIEAPGGIVTIQGLALEEGIFMDDAAAIYIIDNVFGFNVGLSGQEYRVMTGAEALAVIGNTLVQGSIIDIQTPEAVIAGNTLSGGCIDVANHSAWVVGNAIEKTTNSCNASGIEVRSSVQTAQIIGNRITIPAGVTFSAGSGIQVRGQSTSLIAGNLIRVEDDGRFYAIRATAGTLYCEILNNIYFRASEALDDQPAAIEAEQCLVSGNIIQGHGNAAIIADSLSTVRENLCFDNGTNCGTDNGNLEVAPQFVDTVDFRLAATSAGIDAGPPSEEYSDLDRTRNDMGAYGGPWSVEQYDRQRVPFTELPEAGQVLGPYVYPLFVAKGSALDGFIEVRVLGASRLP